MEVAVPLTWEPSPPPHRPVVGRFGGGSTCRRRRPPDRGAGKRRVVNQTLTMNTMRYSGWSACATRLSYTRNFACCLTAQSFRLTAPMRRQGPYESTSRGGRRGIPSAQPLLDGLTWGLRAHAGRACRGRSSVVGRRSEWLGGPTGRSLTGTRHRGGVRAGAIGQNRLHQFLTIHRLSKSPGAFHYSKRWLFVGTPQSN